MKHALASLFVAMGAVSPLLAQSPTRVTATFTSDAGDLLAGNCTIQAVAPFTAAAGWRVVASPMVVKFVGGAFSVSLAPTDTATPSGQFYSVRCATPQQTVNGRTVQSYSWGPTYWLVPTTGSTLDIASVEVAVPPTPSMTVLLQQLSQDGATSGQAMCWIPGTGWAPGNCGSGGSTPSGTPNQVVATDPSGSATNPAALRHLVLLDLPAISTTNVTEGTNLYYTNARVLATMSGLYQTPITGAPSNWPTTFAPAPHAATHQNGGTDEIASFTPSAFGIPKANSGGQLAIGWLASGTPNGAKFVRDDGVLAVPPGTGGGGSVVLTSGAGTPGPPDNLQTSCAAPSSSNLAVWLDTTNQDEWWCSAANTWKKLLSVTGSGPYEVVGATGTAPSNPPSGSVACYFDSTSNTQVCLDSSGNAFTMVKGANSVSHQFVTNTDTAGVQHQAAIDASDVPTLNQNTTGVAANVSGVVAEANGGTGSNNTPGSAGHVLRSNGTHYVDAAIQVGDVPTLNQNTSGTAAGLSAQYIDWSAGSGPTSIANKPTSFTPSAQYKIRTCEIHIWGSGTGQVLQDTDDEPASCYSDFGVTETVTAVRCWANAGSPTITPIVTGGSGLLTGALTCGTASWASGTLSGTPTLSAAGTIDANITTAGGTATNIRIVITLSR